ncbi:MAG: hypothetical protein LBV68_04385 [Spirochaetaceae bacterium]|jgi:hypothetical protein|nr:hypothetical protein [Spirochaetaceae bacterium]
MKKEILKRFEAIEKRLLLLEDNGDIDRGNSVRLDLTLPAADIDGLHFNKQEVCGIFDLKEGGYYYSRDILFMSARDTDDETGKDLLMEYLGSYDFRKCIAEALGTSPGDIKVILPKKNQGMKKYNGVQFIKYWLSKSDGFCFVSTGETASVYPANTVFGCAPAFRII